MNGTGKRKILFVDDSDYVLQSIERMLEDMRGDWDMRFAGSAQAALALVQERFFDVVVSDLKMPGMSGVEVLKTVRQLHPETACFILSGDPDNEDVRKCVAEGYRLMEKPCTPEMLRTIMV